MLRLRKESDNIVVYSRRHIIKINCSHAFLIGYGVFVGLSLYLSVFRDRKPLDVLLLSSTHLFELHTQVKRASREK